MIEWDEPWDADGDINLTCRMTKSDCIKAQHKVVAMHPNFKYKSDDDALEDFITTHWAREVDDTKT